MAQPTEYEREYGVVCELVRSRTNISVPGVALVTLDI